LYLFFNLFYNLQRALGKQTCVSNPQDIFAYNSLEALTPMFTQLSQFMLLDMIVNPKKTN